VTVRSRLSVRLLAASLSIAISAVLATAWLTSQATTERVTGELSRSLEADGSIYSQLTSHASVHANWDRAAPLLAQLSRQTGRAIALRSPDSSFLAGALPSGEPLDENELPTAAAATIDPFAPLLNVVPARLRPLELGTDATLWGRLRPEELADLRERTFDTGACLVDRGSRRRSSPRPTSSTASSRTRSCGLTTRPRPPTTTISKTSMCCLASSSAPRHRST
jgi:two-component system, OmpR family, sensor histidine kinase BaeS